MIALQIGTTIAVRLSLAAACSSSGDSRRRRSEQQTFCGGMDRVPRVHFVHFQHLLQACNAWLGFGLCCVVNVLCNIRITY
mgnify:CR=1 FL=1